VTAVSGGHHVHPCLGGSPSSEHGGAGIEQALARALAPDAQDPIAEIALASAVSVGGTLSI
jgi:hypothetical protein